MQEFIYKKKNILLFLLIICISAVFRVTYLDLIEFKVDEAVYLYLAAQPLFGHPFPAGTSALSIGALNFPLFNYFILPFAAISLDPRFISFCIGLLNSIGIGLFFLIVKKYYGLTNALISSLLFAVAPWSIIFSRKIWIPDVIFIFFIPFFYSLHKIIIDKNYSYWSIYCIFSLFLIQLHPSALFFLLLTTIFLLLQKPKIPIFSVIIGIVIGIIPALPYILYEILNNCPECYAYLNAKDKLATSHSFLVFIRPLQIINSGDFRFVVGDDFLKLSTQFPLIYRLKSVFYLEYIFLPLSMIIFWKQYKHLRFFIYSCALLPLGYFLLKTEPLIHYYVIIMPLLFLFIAVGFSFLFKLGKTIKVISFAILVLFIVISIGFNYSLFRILDEKKGLNGDYGAAYIVNKIATENRFSHIQNDKNYREIILMSYIPQDLLLGNLPLSKILYSYSSTKKNLLTLDAELKRNPTDIRIQNELIAFYSHTTPTEELIKKLRNKLIQNPEYAPIFRQVYGLYLRKNYKNAYGSSNLGFSFEYPSHWNFSAPQDNQVDLRANGFILSFRIQKYSEEVENSENYQDKFKSEILELLNTPYQKNICLNFGNSWCGVTYTPTSYKDKTLYITYKIDPDSSIKNFSEKDINSNLEVMEWIVNHLEKGNVTY